MDFVDNCYLIKHSQGWMLWDTGVADAIANMPDGLKPSDPRATLWKRPKTLAAQLAELNVKPSDIKFVAVVAHPSGPYRQRHHVPAVDAGWCSRPNTTGRLRSARASSRSIRSTSSTAITTCSAMAA